MIRYKNLPNGKPVTLKNLEAFIREDEENHPDPVIRAALKGWLAKARARTDQLARMKKYLDREKWKKLAAQERSNVEEPITVDWSSVKYVFMAIQNQKCAYCERRFAAADSGGTAEHDMEHYRTKNAVRRWPASSEFDFATGDAHSGYYWLAFNLLNYCTACKKCNTGFKRNYFPAAGPTPPALALPSSKMQVTELPYLIYPLGDIDQDPEEVVRFIGLNAFPPSDDQFSAQNVRKDTHTNNRAKVVIRFFDLNGREELLWGRAERLRDLEKSLANMNSSETEIRLAAEADLRRMYSGVSEHTACIRGMIRLYENDPGYARQLFAEIRKYLDSKTPKDYHVVQGVFVPKKNLS